mmetsp:Transcript_20448/g.24847  ORF Transcript_20448/g.24847 Transcript_20448/m.24847 type:complete len:437 (+) Transcript_20448:152-1462(+)
MFQNSPLNARPFKSVFEVRRHWYRTHTTERPYVCDTCPGRKKFASALKSDLNEHKRVCGNERLVWTCANVDCRTKCGTKKALVRHCSNFGHELPNPLVGKPAGSFPLYAPSKKPMQRGEALISNDFTFIGSKPCPPKPRSNPVVKSNTGKQQISLTQNGDVTTTTNTTMFIVNEMNRKSNELPNLSNFSDMGTKASKRSKTIVSGSKLFAYDSTQVAANAIPQSTLATIRTLKGECKHVLGGMLLHSGQIDQYANSINKKLQTVGSNTTSAIINISDNVNSFAQATLNAAKNVVSGSRLWAHETKMIAATNGGGRKDYDSEYDSDDYKDIGVTKEYKQKDRVKPKPMGAVVGGSRLYRHENEVVKVSSGEASVDSIMQERNRRRKEKRRQRKQMQLEADSKELSDFMSQVPNSNVVTSGSNLNAFEVAVSLTQGFT